jgi:V/A-type H+/Na+-transporting ATPase subunit E
MANLAALLEKEASAEIEALLSEARARASEIVASAKSEADEIVAGRERSSTSQYDAALVRAKSAAQLEASSLKLRAQHSAVENVLTAAKGQLDALLKGQQYEGTLQKLLKEALEAVGGNAANVSAVMVNSSDKALAEKIAATMGLQGKVKTDDSVKGGVKLATGTNTIENTLYGRLAALRDELASAVSGVLFKG